MSERLARKRMLESDESLAECAADAYHIPPPDVTAAAVGIVPISV